jgi:hypothetical protein
LGVLLQLLVENLNLVVLIPVVEEPVNGLVLAHVVVFV